MGHLYKLDFANGKSYIGITTKDAARRFGNHRANARKGVSTPLYKAWRKHGEPTLTTLAVLEEDDLPSSEVRAIKAYGTLLPAGYNTLEGGQVSPMGLHSARQKVSSAQKAVWCDEEYRKRILSARTGKKRSEESCRRMSESKKRYYEQLRKEQA